MDNASVTEEQIERARNASLAEYFQRNGYECELKRNELHVKNYGGLFVNIHTNSWYCFSADGQRGGKNAINCLTDVIGLDFKTAVVELAGGGYTYTHSHTDQSKNFSLSAQKKELELPEKDDNMRKVFAYLCTTRKINPEIISQLAHDGLLYQDKKGNAVFVHKNEMGEIIGAEIQGTNSFKRFKGVATGTSDSVFSVKIGDPKKCYVFESAIDLLSFKQLANQEKIQNSVLVSMAGLKPNTLKSLADKGMKMYSCVDCDDAGNRFTEANNLVSCRRILEEQGVKDWNDLLKKSVAQIEQKKPTNTLDNIPKKQSPRR